MDIAQSPNWSDGDVSLFVLRPEDVTQDYVDWLNEPLVNQFLESRFAQHDIDSTRAFVQACLESPNSVMFGIRSRLHGNRHVGNIKIGPIDVRHGLGEIGILIGARESWGAGIGGKAIKLISDVARDQLKLRKLTAGCYGANVGSERAFMKAGFIVEGRRSAHFNHNGAFEDLILMARFL